MELKCLVIDLYNDNSLTVDVVNPIFLKSAYNIQLEYYSSQSDKKYNLEEQDIVLFVTSVHLVLHPPDTDDTANYVGRYVNDLIEIYKFIKYKVYFILIVEFTFRMH